MLEQTPRSVCLVCVEVSLRFPLRLGIHSVRWHVIYDNTDYFCCLGLSSYRHGHFIVCGGSQPGYYNLEYVPLSACFLLRRSLPPDYKPEARLISQRTASHALSSRSTRRKYWLCVRSRHTFALVRRSWAASTPFARPLLFLHRTCTQPTPRPCHLRPRCLLPLQLLRSTPLPSRQLLLPPLSTRLLSPRRLTPPRISTLLCRPRRSVVCCVLVTMVTGYGRYSLDVGLGCISRGKLFLRSRLSTIWLTCLSSAGRLQKFRSREFRRTIIRGSHPSTKPSKPTTRRGKGVRCTLDSMRRGALTEGGVARDLRPLTCPSNLRLIALLVPVAFSRPCGLSLFCALSHPPSSDCLE